MKQDINRWVFQIPVQDVQDLDLDDVTVRGGCFCCGKKIKEEKFMVHLLTNGNLVSSDQEFENSQGLFPIGVECKNRLPNNFIFLCRK